MREARRLLSSWSSHLFRWQAVAALRSIRYYSSSESQWFNTLSESPRESLAPLCLCRPIVSVSRACRGSAPCRLSSPSHQPPPFFPSLRLSNAMSAASCGYWRCTYTSQLTKKHKTFVDGFVRLSCGGCKLSLLAADGGGREVDSAIRAAPFTLHADDELRLEGHIVRIDEPVLLPPPAAHSTRTEWRTTTAPVIAPALQASVAPLAHAHDSATQSSRRAAGLARRGSFRPPARLARIERCARGSSQANEPSQPSVLQPRAARQRAEPDWAAGSSDSAGRPIAGTNSRPVQSNRHATQRCAVSPHENDKLEPADPWHNARCSVPEGSTRQPLGLITNTSETRTLSQHTYHHTLGACCTASTTCR